MSFEINRRDLFLLDHDKQSMLMVDEYNVQLNVYEIKVLEEYENVQMEQNY